MTVHNLNTAPLAPESTEVAGLGSGSASRYGATAPMPASREQRSGRDAFADNEGGAEGAPVAARYSAEFTALYRKHFGFVWRSASGLLSGSRIAVEDVVQDVWLIVHRRWHEFRGDSNERTWLFAITRNVVLNHKRGLRRKGGLQSLDDHDLPDNSSNEREAQAVWRDVQMFMSTLEEQQREVFVSRFLLEMSPGEIADATGRNLISVYAEARKLKGFFKRWLDAQEGEP